MSDAPTPVSARAEACFDILRSNPELPTLQLARMLLKKHPLLFDTVENARDRLRYYRGARGAHDRKWARSGSSGGKFFREPQAPHDPWAGIPPGQKEFEWEPVVITQQKILSLGDEHCPFHCLDALLPALDHGLSENCDCVLFNGDLFDFYELSKFDRNPSQDKLLECLRAGFEILLATRRAFPKARMIFKLGNHDERWERYLWRKAQELLELKTSDLSWVLERPSCFSDHDDKDGKELRLEVIRHPVPIKIGHLAVLHGHELGGGIYSPVNYARTAFLKTVTCALVAHGHQNSAHDATDLWGKTIGCWSQGCMCDRHPRYRPINNWQHGFAVITRFDEENFECRIKKVIKGRVY